MDPDELLTRRLRQALAPALAPLTLSAASRERVREALLGAGPVVVPSRPSEAIAPPTRWRRWRQALGGSPAAVLRRPAWGAAGATLVVAAVLAAVLVPRGGPQPAAAPNAAPPRALVQLPGRPASGPTPSHMAALAPSAGGAAKTRSACPAAAPAAGLVAPVRVTVAVGRATAIALAATGGCAAGRAPAATLEGPGITPARLAVAAAPAPPLSAGSAASVSRSSRYVIRWTGRAGSGRVLPAATYRVLIRLPGTSATATVAVRVGGGQ